MSVGLLREGFRAGAFARESNVRSNASVEGGVVLESLFFGSFASVIPRRGARAPFERAASSFADDSFFPRRELFRVSLGRSFGRSFGRPPGFLLSGAGLRAAAAAAATSASAASAAAASAAAAARVASSSRTMPASPPAALPGLPPRASGTNQPLFPRLPPSLRLPAYPPARVSEEDALSAAAASSSRRISESETKAPGVSVRAGLRPDAAALDADACSCVETVSPPAHTDAKSLGLSFRDASPRPPYAPRDGSRRGASDTAVAPAAGDATPRAAPRRERTRVPTR